MRTENAYGILMRIAGRAMRGMALSSALLLFVFLAACSRVKTSPPVAVPVPGPSMESSSDGGRMDDSSEVFAYVDDPAASPAPPEHAPASTRQHEAARHCPGDEANSAVRDCRLYVSVGYGKPVVLHEESQADQYDQAVAYGQRVMSVLAERLKYAEDHGIVLDPNRLDPIERQAYDYVDIVQKSMHPRIVVTATSINVHRRPGQVGKPPLYKLTEGQVVYFCGGHPGITKPDPVKVPWYWIDREGRCDRKASKDFIASQEVRDGRVFWLVRWHDYDMRFARHHRRESRKEGRTEDAERYDGRIREAPAEILGISGYELWDKLWACLLGVGAGRLVGGLLDRHLVKYAGGTSKAAIAGYLAEMTVAPLPAVAKNKS